MRLVLTSPQPLAEAHRLDAFRCGEATLDTWLKRRALTNQTSGASRCFVVADGQGRVRGYYALATGAVAHAAAAGNVRRNMPDPIPVLVLARLAVDRGVQGHQLGGALLRDALERTAAVADQVGVRALLVHALHAQARAFYLHYGFSASPLDPLLLMLRLVNAGS